MKMKRINKSKMIYKNNILILKKTAYKIKIIRITKMMKVMIQLNRKIETNFKFLKFLKIYA
jgi:hypothetical protein